MADLKVSELTEITSPTVADFIPVVDAGTTKKVSIANLRKVMEWDIHIVKTVAQDVVNNVTVADDVDLQFAVVNGEVWYVEVLLIYSANTIAVDARVNLALPTVQGALRSLGLSTADALQQSTNVLVAATAITDLTFGTLGGLTLMRVAMIELHLVAGASSTFKVQFANGTAGVGNTTRVNAGSLLRAKKLA